MRIGYNPHKDKPLDATEYFHQIIIPVYIPNQEGYFKDSFTILKYCLESVIKTSHNKTYFTIVNNGSCELVKIYLDDLFKENKIHELIHTTSIGKLNAILKGIVGHSFPLITISDSDVLFLNNWQKETYNVFDAFPKAGIVTTTPNSKLVRYLSELVFIDKFISKSIQFSNVVNPKAMIAFADSIGNKNLFNEINLKKYLTLTSSKNIKAVIGSGHFVGTYKGNIFNTIKNKSSDYSLGGDSEESVLDKPVIDNGYWRLATEDNFTYHLGNTFEDWMKDITEKIEYNNNKDVFVPKLVNIKSNKIILWFKINFLGKILFKKPIWRLFLQYKGLSKSEAKVY